MQRDLVIAARDGDHDAYAQLVRASFPRLYGVANLILRDADRAQDAVQDAHVLAWKHVRSLRDPDALDAWLRRLTVRACYKVATREKRRTEVERQVTLDAGAVVTRDHSAELSERDWGRVSYYKPMGLRRRLSMLLGSAVLLAAVAITAFDIARTAARRLRRWKR